MTEERNKTRSKINEIIFGYDTLAGKVFDVVLIILILLSVLAVLLDSVSNIQQQHHDFLVMLEWAFTILFTIEYILRLYSTDSAKKYAFSFYGMVDLLSILPTYFLFLYPAASYLIVIRILRVLRIFRILKLVRYVGETTVMLRAMKNSRRKILVFIFSIFSLNIIFGALMFLVEGPQNGYTSIPVSIYWSIVTMTTVGYGDIAPVTVLGRFLASVVMLTGFAIIAVPTGIISSELMTEFYNNRRDDAHNPDIVCSQCRRMGHDRDAYFCKQCGNNL